MKFFRFFFQIWNPTSFISAKDFNFFGENLKITENFFKKSKENWYQLQHILKKFWNFLWFLLRNLCHSKVGVLCFVNFGIGDYRAIALDFVCILKLGMQTWYWHMKSKVKASAMQFVTILCILESGQKLIEHSNAIILEGGNCKKYLLLCFAIVLMSFFGVL